MAILRVKDDEGNIIDIPAIKGEKGDPGENGKDGKDGVSPEVDYAFIFDKIHPIGSLYWSKDPTDPSELFGGTWIQITDKFILAAGDKYDVCATGGSETVKLTINQMPAHTHDLYGHTYDWGVTEGLTNPVKIAFDEGTNAMTEGYCAGNEIITDQNYWDKTLASGGGQAHNNMPPYEAYYCWRRIDVIADGVVSSTSGDKVIATGKTLAVDDLLTYELTYGEFSGAVFSGNVDVRNDITPPSDPDNLYTGVFIEFPHYAFDDGTMITIWIWQDGDDIKMYSNHSSGGCGDDTIRLYK